MRSWLAESLWGGIMIRASAFCRRGTTSGRRPGAASVVEEVVICAGRVGSVRADRGAGPAAEIASRMDARRPTVIFWRAPYGPRSHAGLRGQPRLGHTRAADDGAVIAATLTPMPESLGATRSSSRVLAWRSSVVDTTLARAWRASRVQLQRAEAFKYSTDPKSVAIASDVVGSYLAPPQDAVVLRVDEMCQIQAAAHTAPMLPLELGLPEQRTTTTSATPTTTRFAALDIAASRLIGAGKSPRRRHEPLASLKRLARAHPECKLQPITDDCATKERVEVRARPATNPRGHGRCAQIGAPSRNPVEMSSGIIGRQVIHWSTFTTLVGRNHNTRTLVDASSDRCCPFAWTKTADEILKQANRHRTRSTDH